MTVLPPGLVGFLEETLFHMLILTLSERFVWTFISVVVVVTPEFPLCSNIKAVSTLLYPKSSKERFPEQRFLHYAIRRHSQLFFFLHPPVRQTKARLTHRWNSGQISGWDLLQRGPLSHLLAAGPLREFVTFPHWRQGLLIANMSQWTGIQLFWEKWEWDGSDISHRIMNRKCEQRIQRCSHPCISSWGCPRCRPRWSCWAGPCHPRRCVWHCGSASGTGSGPGSPETKNTQCTIVSLLGETQWRERI